MSIVPTLVPFFSAHDVIADGLVLVVIPSGSAVGVVVVSVDTVAARPTVAKLVVIDTVAPPTRGGSSGSELVFEGADILFDFLVLVSETFDGQDLGANGYFLLCVACNVLLEDSLLIGYGFTILLR